MNNRNSLTVFFLVLTLIFAPVAWSSSFDEVDGSVRLEFPRDHGAHPDYKTEWWYFVGHLTAENGRTYGFELTFFRVGTARGAASASAWRHHSVYLTHFALTDDTGQKFYHDERTSRGVFGEAGAREGSLEVWNGDWRAELRDDQLTLIASAEDFAVNLTLSPSKPLALHGENGFSRKGPEPGQASYYSSFTRLEGNGKIRTGGEEILISHAKAWMDHEYTSRDLASNIVGWDWFALQLDNGEELMIYQLRRKDGAVDPFSKGSYIRKNGTIETLKADDFSIRVLGDWTSPQTGVRYPSGWEISIPKMGYRSTLIPTVKEQELITQESTGVNYWEGRCLVRENADDMTPTGSAYVELTGYDKALRYG